MLKSAEISAFGRSKVVVTFDLRWPPFCRNERFGGPPKIAKYDLKLARKPENKEMLNSQFDDSKA